MTTWTQRYFQARPLLTECERMRSERQAYVKSRDARLRKIAARWIREGRPDSGITVEALRTLSRFGTKR